MVYKIIDVSRYQGKVNWETVKASGIKGAMLKTVSTNKSYGGIYIDPEFERNYRECKRLGIPVGVYYYTYAQNKQTANLELSMLRKTLNGKSFELPISVDVEDNALKPLSRQALTDLVLYALKTIESWGAYASIYTYTYYKNTELDMARLTQHDLWIADYRGNRPDVPHGMWQFSSKNAFGVPGFGASLDCNYAYKDYPSIIKKAHLNNFTGWKEPAKPGLKTITIGPISNGDVKALEKVIKPEIARLKLNDLYEVK